MPFGREELHLERRADRVSYEFQVQGVQLPNDVDVARLQPQPRGRLRREPRHAGRRGPVLGVVVPRCGAPEHHGLRQPLVEPDRKIQAVHVFFHVGQVLPQNILGRRQRAGEDARVLGPIVQMAGLRRHRDERGDRGAFARFSDWSNDVSDAQADRRGAQRVSLPRKRK